MIRRLLAVILILPLGYVSLAALGGLWLGAPEDILSDSDETVEIALLFGPIHVDFLLPATDETRRAFAAVGTVGVPVNQPEVSYFIVGWGAEQFYTTAGTFADVTFSATARAVIGDNSVLRVDVTDAQLDSIDAPRLSLSPAQYRALLVAISETAGDGPPIAGGFTQTDGFLQATGRFHIFRTCNTWVSRMLRQAGVPAGVWTPTPYAMRLSLWRIGAGA